MPTLLRPTAIHTKHFLWKLILNITLCCNNSIACVSMIALHSSRIWVSIIYSEYSWEIRGEPWFKASQQPLERVQWPQSGECYVSDCRGPHSFNQIWLLNTTQTRPSNCYHWTDPRGGYTEHWPGTADILIAKKENKTIHKKVKGLMPT